MRHYREKCYLRHSRLCHDSRNRKFPIKQTERGDLCVQRASENVGGSLLMSGDVISAEPSPYHYFLPNLPEP